MVLMRKNYPGYLLSGKFSRKRQAGTTSIFLESTLAGLLVGHRLTDLNKCPCSPVMKSTSRPVFSGCFSRLCRQFL
jgi:hypothetical protein